MLISTKGRYALRVMIDLAEHQSEEFISLKEVAQRQEISEKYLESIIRLLVKDRVLESLRGKGGGYRLKKDPDQYTVGSILRLTEESLAPVSCLDGNADTCPRMAQCRTLSLWQGLDRVINEYLDSITIAGIVALELYMTKKVHPAVCILAGIAAFFLIAAVYTSRIAFWILTVLSVINWGCIAGFTVDTLSDHIWGTVVGILVAAVTLGLHIHERSAHS